MSPIENLVPRTLEAEHVTANLKAWVAHSLHDDGWQVIVLHSSNYKNRAQTTHFLADGRDLQL